MKIIPQKQIKQKYEMMNSLNDEIINLIELAKIECSSDIEFKYTIGNIRVQLAGKSEQITEQLGKIDSLVKEIGVSLNEEFDYSLNEINEIDTINEIDQQRI